MKHLKRICKDYGIGQPPQYKEDFITGERRKRTLRREDYIAYIHRRLSLEQIQQYAQKHKIKVYDIIGEKSEKMVKTPQRKEGYSKIKDEQVTKIEVKRQSKFEELLGLIEGDFQDAIYDLKISDEKSLNQQLVMFLRMTFSENIESEVPTEKGRVDILIDGKYALELKYADNKSTLDKGIAEVKRFSKLFNFVAVIIFDINILSINTIIEYKKDYEDLGAEVIILRGRGGRKKKTHKTQITVGNQRITLEKR